MVKKLVIHESMFFLGINGLGNSMDSLHFLVFAWPGKVRTRVATPLHSDSLRELQLGLSCYRLAFHFEQPVHFNQHTTFFCFLAAAKQNHLTSAVIESMLAHALFYLLVQLSARVGSLHELPSPSGCTPDTTWKTDHWNRRCGRRGSEIDEVSSF